MSEPTPDTTPTANIDFEGMVNARDVGGVAAAEGKSVRAGVLFRSETPQLMTASDVERSLAEFGISTVIDLRGPRFGSSGPLSDDGRGVSIDFFTMAGQPDDEAGRSQHGFLPGLLDRAGPVLGVVFPELVAAEGATLVHCHTGKDRTGFVVAITLALLGVADEDIVADYDRSTPIFDQMMVNLTAAGMGVPPEAPPYAQHPPSAEGAAALLVRLQAEWGGAERFLLDVGLDQDLLNAVKAKLLTDG